jgi:hypothetical protein
VSTSNSQPILAKTGNYTVTGGDGSALITNRGASGAVTITLPAQTAVPAGFWVDVFCVAAQNLTVATATTDTLVVDGDAAADSISWETSSHQIGNGARFVADGTGWLCILSPAATSTTIATQTIVTN